MTPKLDKLMARLHELDLQMRPFLPGRTSEPEYMRLREEYDETHYKWCRLRNSLVEYP